jgi:hypothetical protein
MRNDFPKRGSDNGFGKSNNGFITLERLIDQCQQGGAGQIGVGIMKSILGEDRSPKFILGSED